MLAANRSRLPLAAVLTLVTVALLASGFPTVQAQLLVDLTVAGVVVGAIFALSALGLVVTYRATGVFNLAHGAVAITVTYALWQLVRGWGLPVAVAAPIALLGVGPAIGLALEFAVFRPLARAGAGIGERLVATVGVFVLLIGAVMLTWGRDTRTDPVRLFPGTALNVEVPGTGLTVTLGVDQLGVIAVTATLGLALWFLLHRTWLGIVVRAVVDRLDVAELAGIDSRRVAAGSWAVGCGLAGLTGVLLAPITFGLEPFRLTLLVTETFAVAVIARLVSLPLAFGGGLFLGLLSTYGQAFSFSEPADLVGASEALAASIGRLLDPLLVSVSVLALFAVLVLNRRLQEVGDDEAGAFATRAALGARRLGRRGWAVVAAGGATLPLLLEPGDWRYAHTFAALAVVLLSIVAITGLSGHITLGQAGIAGFGAFMTGRLHAGTVAFLPALPAPLAMVVAALACIPIGLLAAWTALRRRGLFVALTTFALGLVLQRFVFESAALVSGGVLDLSRPELAGVSAEGDLAFWWYELAVLAMAVILTRNLGRDRLGRMLGAIRDSEPAARAVGIDVAAQKMMIFSVSAFLAGVGGALLAQTARAFSGEQFVSFNSLLWFAAVMVAGVASVEGALVGAALLTLLGAVVDPGLSIFLVGLGAVALGRFPGGLVAAVAPPPPAPPVPPVPLEPTARAKHLLSGTWR